MRKKRSVTYAGTNSIITRRGCRHLPSRLVKLPPRTMNFPPKGETVGGTARRYCAKPASSLIVSAAITYALDRAVIPSLSCSGRRRSGCGRQVGFDDPDCPRDVISLLSHRRDELKRGFGVFARAGAQHDPSGEILRGEAATGCSDVALGIERLIDDCYTGLNHPFFRTQIGACRSPFEQPKLGQKQRT